MTIAFRPGGTKGCCICWVPDEANPLRKGEFIMGSTADKISGKANELAGKAKQGVGKATGSHETQAKGAAQEAKGDAQQAKGHIKDAAKSAVGKS